MSDVTDTTTETRDLIARVRADIAPADQPQALYDLARTADGEPRLDAGMLRQEADGIEGEERGMIDATEDAIRVVEENDRLRARVAELEAKLAESESESLAAAVALAQADSEADEMCDRLSDVLGEACGLHAPMSAPEIVDAIEREVCRFKEGLATAYQSGAEAMRERAAALLRSPEARELYVLLGPRAIMALANQIADLPLDDDAREDAQGDDNGR